MVEICIEYNEQLHVSAFDNGHLRVEKMKKKLSKQLYSTYVGCIQWGGEMGTRSRMCCVGWAVWVDGVFCYYMLCLGNMVRSTVSSYVCRYYMYI